MLKAMYVLLRSALLFYLKLRKDLEEFDFVINDYDPCVANKIINGTQMTVVWHVDDLKVSHKDGLRDHKISGVSREEVRAWYNSEQRTLP
eukprot:CCRYP_018544-RA/>CCRYP_018544-RA protein AED:0.46 eAED:0.50 QI:0/-1/0/1/-1/0/1/0/89